MEIQPYQSIDTRCVTHVIVVLTFFSSSSNLNNETSCNLQIDSLVYSTKQ